MTEQHELRLNHHVVTAFSASQNSLHLDTEWLNAKAQVILGLFDWRPKDLQDLGGQVVGDTILRAGHDDSGLLDIEFVTGLSIQCPPSDQFEAWTVIVRPGPMRWCPQGGGWDGFG